VGAKQNTFSDYIAVADSVAGWLVDGNRLATRGLSAGGLLQAAVFSQRPDRWRAVVAEVPFVDVVTTMLDSSIPLTVNEWDEWGDPRRPEDFAWMLAYSPYDNLAPAGGRPDLLVTAAVHDPRVYGLGTGQVGGRAACERPGMGTTLPVPLRARRGCTHRPFRALRPTGYEAEVYAWVLAALVGAAAGSRSPF